MMKKYKIKKGYNIKIKGKPVEEIEEGNYCGYFAIQPEDFQGIRPRLKVKVEDKVKKGTVLFINKDDERIVFVSPVSGKIVAINRGEKRVIKEIVIESDKKQHNEEFNKITLRDGREKIIEILLKTGLWSVIRQRPFSKIANVEDKPKSIFITAINTAPLAENNDFILEEQEKDFQFGINIIRKLTKGKVHLCTATKTKSKALAEIENANIHQFEGKHPTGNISTHIQQIDSLKKGEIIWYIGAQDVIRIAKTMKTGEYCSEKIIALTGEGVQEKARKYIKTTIGVQIVNILKGSEEKDKTYISGNILTGKNVGFEGYLGSFDNQITVIPSSKGRELLGWLVPGFKKYTLTRTYISSFLPKKEYSLTTDENGGQRAIVFNSLYDKYITLDIYVFFLLRAIISGEIEDSEQLGLIECDEEDFALCTFACPSKVNVGQIIKQGLEILEEE